MLRLLDTVAAAGFESCVVVVAKDDIGTVPTLVNANGGQYELQASNNITDNGSGSTEFESVGSFSHPMAFLRKPSSGTSNNNNHKSSSSSSSSFFKVTVVPVSEDCAGSAEALKQLELLDSSNASAPSSPSSGKLLLLPSTSHVVVLPGDLVVLDPKALIQLVDAHRQGNILPSSKQHRHSAVTMLLADVGEQDEHGIPLKESAKVRHTRHYSSIFAFIFFFFQPSMIVASQNIVVVVIVVVACAFLQRTSSHIFFYLYLNKQTNK